MPDRQLVWGLIYPLGLIGRHDEHDEDARTEWLRRSQVIIVPSRALYCCVAHARGLLPKNPPEPPLREGGKWEGSALFLFPPLGGGIQGGSSRLDAKPSLRALIPGVCHPSAKRSRTVIHLGLSALGPTDAGILGPTDGRPSADRSAVAPCSGGWTVPPARAVPNWWEDRFKNTGGLARS
jgi:hypothetical protein